MVNEMLSGATMRPRLTEPRRLRLAPALLLPGRLPRRASGGRRWHGDRPRDRRRRDRPVADLRSADLPSVLVRPVPQPLEALLRCQHLRQPAACGGLPRASRGQPSSPSGREVARLRRRTAHSALPADGVARVTDWERHGDFVPFTTVHGGPRDPRRARAVRRPHGDRPTGLRRPMVVTYSRPPSRGRVPASPGIVKQGRVVLGWAVLTVTPTESGSEVRWHEEARLRGTRGPVASARRPGRRSAASADCSMGCSRC